MNILGIGAHPDDLEFGCGGILCKLAAKGHKISMLVLTGGGVGGAVGTRKEEQECSARLLKARLLWGGFNDTDLQVSRELIQTLERHIEHTKPDLIFINYHEDTHQDHRNAAKAAVTAARYTKNLVFYEVPTTLNFIPTVFSDIGPVIGKKVQLLRCHRSQVYKTRVKNLSIIETAKSTAVFRGYQDRVKYAEGFTPQRLLLDLVLGID
jgi:LmbE family N-acetylglucosaminyl deacetylase